MDENYYTNNIEHRHMDIDRITDKTEKNKLINNYYISKLEKSIIEITSNTDIISYNDIKNLFPKQHPQTLKQSIAKLCRIGYLHRLRKGLYYSTPDMKLVINDPLSVAALIYPGYIGFSTALRFYNLVEYEPFYMFIVTNNRSTSVWLGEYTFRYVSMGRRATGAANVNGIWVSTPEKTFFDCFYKPRYAGGYGTITRALYEARKIDWEIFGSYMDDLASNSMRQRTGYILDLLKSKTGFSVPKRVLEALQPKDASYVWLQTDGPRKGNRIKKWKIFDNIGDARILEWWYNG